MTEKGYPWQGTSVGDAGPYSNLQWDVLQQYITGLGGSRANVGPLLGSGTQPNDGLKVTQHGTPNTQVDVNIGAAMVQGIFYLNDALKSLTIAANASGNARIDTVILRADYTAQTVRLAVLQGTPAATPNPPSLTQSAGVQWEIPIADIAVANGFVTITNANITPRHEWINAANGVYLDNVLNNSGGTLVTGDVVIWDTGTDQAVTTTTTANNARVAGVWVGRTANGAYGRVLQRGIGLVQVAGAYSRATGLNTSSTAKRAENTSGQTFGNLGMLLEASTGAGELRLTFVDVIRRQTAIAVYSNRQTSGTTGPNYTNGTNTVVLNTEVSDADGIGAVAANQVTIQPGVYFVHGEIYIDAQAARTCRALLFSVTGAAVALVGLNARAAVTAQSTIAPVSGYISVATPIVYELRLWASGNFGGAATAVSSGDQENYAELTFERI